MVGSIFFLPFFSIKKIHISPLHFILQKKCEETLSPLLNQNIFWVVLSQSIQRSLEKYPQINAMNIHINSLSELSVTIKERTPWISCIVDGHSVFIDREGIILTKSHNNNYTVKDNLFIIKGLASNLFSKERISAILLKKLHHLRTLFQEFLPNAPLLLEASIDGSWSIMIHDTIYVLLGNLEDLSDKFERLQYFLGTLNRSEYSNISYIDLRINHKLLVKYEQH